VWESTDESRRIRTPPQLPDSIDLQHPHPSIGSTAVAPEEDAAVVALLMAAGALPLGKAGPPPPRHRTPFFATPSHHIHSSKVLNLNIYVIYPRRCMGCLPPPPSRFVIFVLQVKPPVLNFFTFFWREKNELLCVLDFFDCKVFPIPQKPHFRGSAGADQHGSVRHRSQRHPPRPLVGGCVCGGGGVACPHTYREHPIRAMTTLAKATLAAVGSGHPR